MMRRNSSSSAAVFTAAVLMAVSGAASAATEIAHWELEDTGILTATDTVGSHPGSLINMDATTDWVAGKIGGGLDFDGGDDFVDTSKTATQMGMSGDASRAVAFWAFTRGWNEGAAFTVGNYQASEMFCLRTTWNTNVWRIDLWGDYKDIYIPGSDNEWMHLVLVHEEGVGSKLYANAELVCDLPGMVLNTTDTGTFRLGIFQTTDVFKNWYNGILDDVRVYNEALTPADVQGIYNVAYTGTAPTIVKEPSPRTVSPGGTAAFTIRADGEAPRTYQWESSPDGTAWTAITTGTGFNTLEYVTDVLTLGDDDTQIRCTVTNGVGSASSASALLSVRVPTLLGYWSFNDEADPGHDDSGNALDGTLDGTINGGPTWDSQGAFGGGLVLDGTDDMVVVGPVGLSYPSVGRTISGWARLDGPDVPWANIFGFSGDGGLVRTYFDVELISPWYGHAFGLHVYGHDFHLANIDNEWHHYVVSYDETEVVGYLDGTEVFRNDRNGAGWHGLEPPDIDWSLNTVDNFVMGKRSDAEPSYFSGAIDEVRVYDGVLGPDDISFLMAPGRYWVGGTGPWSDAAHWASHSGGTGGTAVPSSIEIATFDHNSGGGTVTIDAAIDVFGIEMENMGSGLVGSYYQMTDDDEDRFDLFVRERVDASVDFPNPDAGLTLGPVANRPDGYNFAVRWVGQVNIEETGDYIFSTTTDDGARLWVEDILDTDTPDIDQWVAQAATKHDVTINFAATGWVDIRFDYYQGFGDSAAQLSWQPPSAVANVTIPAASFRINTTPVTVDQTTSAITIGDGGYTQDSGVFVGGSVAMEVGGALAVSGGDFTATSDVLTFLGDVDLSGGTFTHNSGTVVFGGTSVVTVSPTDPLILNDLTIDAAGSLTAPADTLTVEGIFTNDGTFVHNDGTVVLSGAAAEIAGAATTTFGGLTVGDEAGDVTSVSVDTVVGGELTLLAGTTLNLSSTAGLTLSAASTFSTSGTLSWAADEFALVTNSTLSDYYPLSIGGNVSASYVQFEQLDASGLVLSGGASITKSFSNVKFVTNEGGIDSTHLEIAGAGWNGYTFDGFSFEGTDQNDPMYAAAISSGGTVSFTTYDETAGMIFGDHFDRDADLNPNDTGTVAGTGRINWVGGAGAPAPGAFDLIAPANDEATALLDWPLLQWGVAPYAEDYTISVYDNVGRTGDPIFEATGLTGTSYQTAYPEFDYDIQYWWIVTATTSDVNQSTDATAAFTFVSHPDGDPPFVVWTDPDEGDKDVDIDTTIVIAFNEAMNETVTGNAFVISPSEAGSISWSADSTTMTFTPNSDLEYGSRYTIFADWQSEDVAGNQMGTAYRFRFKTRLLLPGIAAEGASGCVSGSGEGPGWFAPFAVLLALTLAFGRKRVARSVPAVVVVAALLMSVGCTGASLSYDSVERDSLIGAEPVAALSAAPQSSGPEIKWSPRGGVAVYMGSDIEVPPRVTVGLYGRMLETETMRVEVALDIAPDFAAEQGNFYFAFTGDYVQFLGEGSLQLRGGGGAIMEMRGDEQFFLGVIEAGAGYWLPVGDRDNAFVASAMLQFPLGDVNVTSVLAITAGYEF